MSFSWLIVLAVCPLLSSVRICSDSLPCQKSTYSFLVMVCLHSFPTASIGCVTHSLTMQKIIPNITLYNDN